jgi:hypothetical protein
VFLSFCLYRRANVITNEKETLQIHEKKCKAILAIKYPTLYRFAVEADILWNYAVVALTFGAYLSILVFQHRTFINGLQQLLVLALVCVYYTGGLASLISRWQLLIASSAIVLCLEIVYQFMQQTGIFKHIKSNHPFWASLPPNFAYW